VSLIYRVVYVGSRAKLSAEPPPATLSVTDISMCPDHYVYMCLLPLFLLVLKPRLSGQLLSPHIKSSYTCSISLANISFSIRAFRYRTHQNITITGSHLHHRQRKKKHEQWRLSYLLPFRLLKIMVCLFIS
jgi:hypothetical protein